MLLTVLVDGNTILSNNHDFNDRYFLAEPGLSFHIKDGEKTILFDTGHTDVFLQNAQKMNIDLSCLDYVVLSHGHIDHTGGLNSLISYNEEVHNKPILVAHPDCFLPKRDPGWGYIGSKLTENNLSEKFDMKLSKDPLWLTDNLVFLGEIERKNNFENQNPLGKVTKDEIEEDDFQFDDSAIVYKSKDGLVVISGCSHVGICNIIEQAKKVCKDNRILEVIGGLHLINPTEIHLNSTLNYFKEISPKIVHPCHCTALKPKIALAGVCNLEETGVGMQFEY
ncbi:MAG: MBL fold metallo-hydrolase [Eubacteriales bacterium]